MKFQLLLILLLYNIKQSICNETIVERYEISRLEINPEGAFRFYARIGNINQKNLSEKLQLVREQMNDMILNLNENLNNTTLTCDEINSECKNIIEKKNELINDNLYEKTTYVLKQLIGTVEKYIISVSNKLLQENYS